MSEKYYVSGWPKARTTRKLVESKLKEDIFDGKSVNVKCPDCGSQMDMTSTKGNGTYTFTFTCPKCNAVYAQGSSATSGYVSDNDTISLSFYLDQFSDDKDLTDLLPDDMYELLSNAEDKAYNLPDLPGYGEPDDLDAEEEYDYYDDFIEYNIDKIAERFFNRFNLTYKDWQNITSGGGWICEVSGKVKDWIRFCNEDWSSLSLAKSCLIAWVVNAILTVMNDRIDSFKDPILGLYSKQAIANAVAHSKAHDGFDDIFDSLVVRIDKR